MSDSIQIKTPDCQKLPNFSDMTSGVHTFQSVRLAGYPCKISQVRLFTILESLLPSHGKH